METVITETEILDYLKSLKSFFDSNKLVIEAFPELLEKHNATDIKSGFADKLDTISDPYERLLVGIHTTDQIDVYDVFNIEDLHIELQTSIKEEMDELNKRHRHLLEVALYMNYGDVEKASVSLRKYLKNFK
jgi:hypothetical protein